MPDPVTRAAAGALVAGTTDTFDAQAPMYDARTGLPESVVTTVARAIVDHVDADDLLVELGAGTGEIGVQLARLPVRYVGLDNSRAMLAVFRARANRDSPSLAVADCNQPWPLPDGSAGAIFASRVIHLLDPEHVVSETNRVCRAGGTLILGRVLRERNGIKERLRRRRQELLVEAGLTPRQGEAGTRRVIAFCLAAGGEQMPRREVAEWTGETTATNILAGWDMLARAGSVPLDRVTHVGIMTELGKWARAEFGDLERAETFRERYVIDIVRLPALPRDAGIAGRSCKNSF